MTAGKQLKEKYAEFVRILRTTENSLKVSQEAFSVFADIYPISTVEVAIKVPKSAVTVSEEDRNIVFYRSRGEEGDEFVELPIHTGQNGVGCFRLTLKKGAAVSEEDRANLLTLIKLFQFHSGRFHLIEQMSEYMMTQYLTGLPNAGGFMHRCMPFVWDGSISSYDSYCFNLRGFWFFNKKYGQQEGDSILKRYADLLADFVQPDEVAGHLGGDNFVALIHRNRRDEFLAFLNHTETYAMRKNVKEPVVISAAAGVFELGKDTPAEQLIPSAVTAMGFAKRTRRPVVYMTKELNQAVNNAKQIEQRFPSALENGEFQVYYQPKVDTRTGEIIGAEALSRWCWNNNVLPAMAYIPILEQSDDIVALDLYMLEKACHDLHVWKENGNVAVPLSLNFSRKDINHPDMAKQIIEIVRKYDISSNELIIEVTETAGEEEKDRMLEFLMELSDAGIRSSIDDFGTGYSSLGMLREFPISEIKIDSSFINHVLNQSDEIILRNIICMARGLNIHVITEGVEQKDQASFLEKIGCPHVQGFLFDEPLEKETFESKLRKHAYCIPE